MTLFWLIACNNQLIKEYEQEKETVLQAAPALKDNWKPDILLRLDYGAISKIAKRYVEKEIKGYKPLKKKFLGKEFVAKPKLNLKTLTLSDAPAKDAIQFRTVLDGNFTLSWGPFKEKLKTKAVLQGIAKIELNDGENQLSFSKLQKIKITIGELGGKNIAPMLEEWLEKEFLKTKKISLGSFDLSNLHLRGIRLNSTPTSTNIEMRSDTLHTNNLKPSKLQLKRDWELQVHQDVLLGWSRRLAFEKGIIDYGVAVDPRKFSVTEQEFDIDVRLWKLDGFSKWWREYSVHGDIAERKGRFKFTTDEITKADDSKGVSVVDPLVVLAESLLLDDMTEKLTYALPMQKKSTLDGLTWKFKVENFKGHGDQLSITGSWTEVQKKKGGKKGKNGKK